MGYDILSHQVVGRRRMNDTRPETYVIDLTGNTKEAALYFDWVVPLSFYAGASVKGGAFRDSQFLRQVVPLTLFTSAEPAKPCRDYAQAVDAMHLAVYQQLGKYPEHECLESQKQFAGSAVRMIEARPELHCASLLLPDSDPLPGLDAGSDFLITLMNLSLVDAEKASWDQVLEFRKDEKARMALRRLKLFAIKEYSGKDKGFIADDLLLKIEAHNNAVRDWGFETRVATLSNFLGSKVLLGGLAGAALSSIFGTNWVAAASAATGITIELGNIAIDLAKRNYSLATMRRDHPLAYIIRAQKQLSGE